MFRVCILIVARGSDYLLVDISNSDAKFAFASTRRVLASTRITTSELSSDVIARFLRKRNVRKVVVSSVVPAKNSVILKAAGKTHVIWLNWKLKLGVEIDYPQRMTWKILGIEPWLCYWFGVSMVAGLAFRRVLNVQV